VFLSEYVVVSHDGYYYNVVWFDEKREDLIFYEKLKKEGGRP
jgi:hypothetical protein